MHSRLSRGRIWGAVAVIALVLATVRVATVAAIPLAPATCAEVAANPHGVWAYRTISGCNFAGLDFSGVDFHGSTLNGDNFSRANLSWADLSQTSLNGDNFSYANLEYVDGDFAVVESSNFSYADVWFAHFCFAHFDASDNQSHLVHGPIVTTCSCNQTLYGLLSTISTFSSSTLTCTFTETRVSVIWTE